MRLRTCARQEGQVIMFVVLSLVVLVGTIGLAMDSGIGYLIKSKLNAAVDSAVIAGARTVSQGNTQELQRSNAVRAARNFFDANYPSGYLGSHAQLADPTVTFDGGQVVLDARASATVSTTFMRILDMSSLTVVASAQALRKDLDMAVVIDTTGSMNTGTVPAQVRSNTALFLSKFNQTLDRVALIQYAYGAVVRDPFQPTARGFNLSSMTTHIDAFTFAGSTNSAEGVWQARDQLNRVIELGSRSSLRVIVFFSDGAPNSFSSAFAFSPAGACTAAGTISTSDSTTANWPSGLRNDNQIDQVLPGGCWQKTPAISNPAAPTHVAKLPDWYNAHNPTDDPALREFPIVVSSGARIVTNETGTLDKAWTNVNRAARNLLEAMAAKSRSERIYVFTLGLGNALTVPAGPDGEKGEDILKCMANVPDAPLRCVQAGATQPIGTYCHAADEYGLKPCFDKLASAILRITK